MVRANATELGIAALQHHTILVQPVLNSNKPSADTYIDAN